jgi:hypothetical protein
MSASVRVQGTVNGETRQDYLTTALAPGEVITEASVPALDGYGTGYLSRVLTRRALEEAAGP